MIWLWLACAGGGDKTPAETGAPGDSAGGEAGDTGPVWNCGIYAPQAVLWTTPGEVGYRSVFAVDDSAHPERTRSFEGLGTAEVDGLETWVHLLQDSFTDTDGTTHVNDTTTWYLCDALGLQQHRVESHNVITRPDGAVTEMTVSRLYTVAPVVYPPDMKLGDTWAFYAEYTESRSDGASDEGVVDVTRAATEVVSISVPAGDFETLHLVLTDNESGDTESLWVAQEVGMVQTDDMALLSHETFGP